MCLKLLCLSMEVSGSKMILPNNCIPTIAYIKNNMAINIQTYGRAYQKIKCYYVTGHISQVFLLLFDMLNKYFDYFTLKDCTKVYRSIRTLTLRLNNLMRRAARKSLRKPTLTNLVASIMEPTTVTKSKPFHESLK